MPLTMVVRAGKPLDQRFDLGGEGEFDRREAPVFVDRARTFVRGVDFELEHVAALRAQPVDRRSDVGPERAFELAQVNVGLVVSPCGVWDFGYELAPQFDDLRDVFACRVADDHVSKLLTTWPAQPRHDGTGRGVNSRFGDVHDRL